MSALFGCFVCLCFRHTQFVRLFVCLCVFGLFVCLVFCLFVSFNVSVWLFVFFVVSLFVCLVGCVLVCLVV